MKAVTPQQILEYMTFEVRVYMAMRYFKTTRCCLTLEQITHICEEEIKVIFKTLEK